MVEFELDTENQRCVCKSPKNISSIIIEKERGGFVFFVVRMEKGTLPKELSGRYSSMSKAQYAVSKYVKNKPQSVDARRKEYGDNYEKRKKAKDAAKSKSESSEQLCQGLDHGSSGADVS